MPLSGSSAVPISDIDLQPCRTTGTCSLVASGGVYVAPTTADPQLGRPCSHGPPSCRRKVSDSGLALPYIAYPQHKQESAAALNEDITVMDEQQQLVCVHNGHGHMLLAKLACQLSSCIVRRRLLGLDSCV